MAFTTVVSSTLSAALLLGVGRLAYGATVSPGALPALLVTVVAGVVVFCCLGFAVAGLVRSFDSAQPVVTALALPLMFISGVFIPWSLVPHWLQQVSAFFPVRPLAVDVLDPYLTHGAGSWDPAGLAVLGAWGLVAVIGAVRWFRWAPRDGDRRAGAGVVAGGGHASMILRRGAASTLSPGPGAGGQLS